MIEVREHQAHRRLIERCPAWCGVARAAAKEVGVAAEGRARMPAKVSRLPMLFSPSVCRRPPRFFFGRAAVGAAGPAVAVRAARPRVQRAYASAAPIRYQKRARANRRAFCAWYTRDVCVPRVRYAATAPALFLQTCSWRYTVPVVRRQNDKILAKGMPACRQLACPEQEARHAQARMVAGCGAGVV